MVQPLADDPLRHRFSEQQLSNYFNLDPHCLVLSNQAKLDQKVRLLMNNVNNVITALFLINSKQLPQCSDFNPTKTDCPADAGCKVVKYPFQDPISYNVAPITKYICRGTWHHDNYDLRWQMSELALADQRGVA